MFGHVYKVNTTGEALQENFKYRLQSRVSTLQDVRTTALGLKTLRSAVPTMELVRFPDTGHYIHDDKPTVFAEVSMDFFSRASKRSM